MDSPTHGDASRIQRWLEGEGIKRELTVMSENTKMSLEDYTKRFILRDINNMEENLKLGEDDVWTADKRRRVKKALLDSKAFAASKGWITLD